MENMQSHRIELNNNDLAAILNTNQI